MQQSSREISHQELVKGLRNIREDLFLIDQTLKAHVKSVLIPDSENIQTEIRCNKRALDGIINARRCIQQSRHALRELLEIADVSGCYPDPPTDIPENPSPLSSGLESITEVIEEIEDNLKDLITATSEYYMEGWAVRYHEQAVMGITIAKQGLRFSNSIRDETEFTREKERLQGGSNRLHNADRGFQASGRAGQH